MIHFLRLAVVAALALLGGCAGAGSSPGDATGLHGHLLIIGGGLDDDNKPVYERFIELATPRGGDGGAPRVVIATAASANQPENATGKIESIRAYCPAAKIDVIMRETPTAETVALIEQATAMFFTGGDQKRITARYRPEGVDTPEAAAMRRLLARGGVIAGTSAGDAMMSDPMFLTGRSAEALGIVSTRMDPNQDADPEAPKPKANASPVLGPQIGPGMGFLPWAVTDSHFFERHRFGRLVAGLEASKRRLGIGVGEDAAVEVDLATGELIGISVADSLLVDVGALRREGLDRSGIRARVVTQGMRVSLTQVLTCPAPTSADIGEGQSGQAIPIVEAGQNRQLASWRFFTRVGAGTETWVLKLDGYELVGRGDGGWSVVEIRTISTK
ncbi:MAG: cyanophycinase [Phycisphaerales bacterium]